MRVAMVVLNDMTADARVAREARELVSAGHTVDVCALRAPGLPDVDRSDAFTVRRVAEYTSAPLSAPVAKLRQHRARTRALTEALVSLAPDVVHCHDTDTLAAGASAAARLGVPYVYDAHELYPDSLMQRPFQRSWPVQTRLRLLERRLIPGAAAVITVCDGLAEVLRERYGVQATVVANCPGLRPVGPPLLRERLGIPADRAVVLYQGALLPGRAIDELLEAVARVPRAALVVQGRGEYEGAMRARVASLGIGERVHLMGQVPHDDLFALTCGADVGTVFLDGVTLNHRLAWPNRVFMYLMAGVPVLGTNLPGLRQLLMRPGQQAGLLTPPGDAVAIAAAIESVLGDPGRRRAMGEAGRALAEAEYHWEAQAVRLRGVYERLGG